MSVCFTSRKDVRSNSLSPDGFICVLFFHTYQDDPRR